MTQRAPTPHHARLPGCLPEDAQAIFATAALHERILIWLLSASAGRWCCWLCFCCLAAQMTCTHTPLRRQTLPM